MAYPVSRGGDVCGLSRWRGRSSWSRCGYSDVHTHIHIYTYVHSLIERQTNFSFLVAGAEAVGVREGFCYHYMVICTLFTPTPIYCTYIHLLISLLHPGQEEESLHGEECEVLVVDVLVVHQYGPVGLPQEAVVLAQIRLRQNNRGWRG
jgi:hypothetical protein